MLGGATLTSLTYAATTDNFNWCEFGLALTAGALGGGMIATGVGAVAGGAMIAAAWTGAGVGTLVAAEGYMVTTDDFDSRDFAIHTTLGGVEGAVAANVANPLAAGGISLLSSGVGAVASDVTHNRPVDWDRAASNAVWGGATGFISAGLVKQAVEMASSPGIGLGQSPPIITWVPPNSIAKGLVAELKYNKLRAALRSASAELFYYLGSDKVYELFNTP
jgi:hypothetical protein